MYEWFITESFKTKTQLGLFHVIRARCVTEKYDVMERFRLDDTTLSCTALEHWMNILGKGVTKPPHEYLIPGFHFFAAVQPKFNTTACKQKLYYELDVLSLASSAGNEQVVDNVSSEVDRIIALGKSRSETLAMLREKGNEYLKDARVRGLVA
jgi:hypothetical protein